MRKVALDLGKKKTAFCEVADGQVVRRKTVERLEELRDILGPDQAPATVAIEACRQAWHVRDRLMEWGNEVLIVDTTRRKQVGVAQHGRKTDRLDAEALARAVERGGIPIAHVLSPARRELRRYLGARRAVVEARANFVTTVRGLVQEWGGTLRSCTTPLFVRRVREAQLDPRLMEIVDPLLKVIETLDRELVVVEAMLAQCCAQEPLIEQLTTAPGVGPIVASAFVSVIDEAERFPSGHHVQSYLGLVPSEDSSGGKHRIGAITKAGNPYLRALLIQGAWAILQRASDDDPLKLWGKTVAERRGRRIAVVAVARRLVGVLWAMWRDGTLYDATELARQGNKGLQGAIRTIHRNAETLA